MTRPEMDASSAAAGETADEGARFGDRTVHAGRAVVPPGGRDEDMAFPQRPAATEPPPRDARRRPVRRPNGRPGPLRDWDAPPRILVTNDDGIDSRGLLALRQALDPIGEVVVVAPETNQSAVGHGKTFMRPLRVRRRTLADGSRGWSVDGSPTDAVSLAFLGFFEETFDLVASGINYGANLGDDVTYSGTVSAAMEAVINGCPAFAISLEYFQDPDFSLAGRVARQTAINILEHGLGPGELLNVNVPAGHGTSGVFEVTRMGKRIYQDQLIERLDPRGVPYYWIGGPAPSGEANEGTDFHAVVNGRIAVTPIQLDLTADRLLRRVAAWDWELPPEAPPGSSLAESLDRP